MVPGFRQTMSLVVNKYLPVCYVPRCSGHSGKGRMNRRRFLLSAASVTTVAVGNTWLAPASAATDDELAYANFGASAELLAQDFYARAIEARTFSGGQLQTLRRGRRAAAQHAKALGDLLVGAGQVAPSREDFEFAFAAKAFASAGAIVTTGVAMLGPLRGAYQTASAVVVEPSYRVLYASLAASLGEQIGACAALSGRVAAEPFPAAVDLEAASAALEGYLG